MSKLLFTGGTGYIGSHTVVEFLMAGYEIVILDNLSNSNTDILDAIEKITKKRPTFYKGDIRERELLENIFQSHDIFAVIHFAGLKAVGESCELPALYHDNNIIGSIILFEMMEKYHIKNIVFSSSATVYSDINTLPWKEDGILATSNPYGTTKLVIEYLLRDYVTHKGWHVINLRYFNPIGAHPSGLLGEDPQGIPNNLLPYIMKVVTGEQEHVRVYGDDYDTPDGTGVRDYIHVVDLASGHEKAFEYITQHQDTGYMESINLGTGKGTSVLEMIKLTSFILGRDIPYQIYPRRSGDLAIFYCDPSRAFDILGWKTESDIHDAIVDTLRFIQHADNHSSGVIKQ